MTWNRKIASLTPVLDLDSSLTPVLDLDSLFTWLPMVYYSAIMSKKSQHVVPNPKGGWSVKSQGASRAIKTFDTQGDAVSWARSKSRREGLDLIVHGRDGTIRSSDSYRRDPSPPQQHNGRK